MKRLEGKSAIVTGAAHGLGRAIASRLADEGAAVMVADARRSDAEATADGLRSAGYRAESVEVDVSDEMVEVARGRVADGGPGILVVQQGSGESIPAPDQSFDVVLSSLTIMYVIDRASAAREIARVLRPGGRLVAAVWGGSDECDIVQF